MARRFNITALFAGIGGMEAGFHRHANKPTLFCECDPEATAVLDARFPGVPLNFDIRKTDALVSDIDPNSDLVTAGFPCTDFSQAGRTLGFEGSQSVLVRKLFDLLDARTFPHVLIENVPNWRVLHGGRYMSEVIDSLEARDYRWAYRTIDVRAFGLPQRRLRVFLFATKESDDPRYALFHGSHIPDDRIYALDEAAHGFYWTEGTKGLGWGENCIPTLKGGSAVGIPASPAVLRPSGAIITPDLRDAERLQGFPAGWTDLNVVLPEFGTRKFNQRRRWMLIGNAVNVEVSDWIAQQLAAARPYDGPPGAVISAGGKWPIAAWFDGTTRRAADVGTRPVQRDLQPLDSFLTHQGALLSRRATEGFYNRLMKSRLRVKPEFKVLLANHLERMQKCEERIETIPIAAE